MLTALVGIALAAATPAIAQIPEGLAEQLSYPFLTGLVAADRADRITWVSVVKGVRTVWSASGPDYRPRAVFTTNEDDGQELTNLVIAPDGKAMAWVRGGDHDANWDATGGLQPDARSDTEQPQLEIWYARAGGRAAKVAEGDSPALSASGRIAFVSNCGDHSFVGVYSAKDQPLLWLSPSTGYDESPVRSPDGSRMRLASRSRVFHCR